MKNVFLAAVVFLLIISTGYFAGRWRAAETRLDKSVASMHSLVDSLAGTVRIPPPPMFAERDTLYWKWVAVNAQMNLMRFRNVAAREARLRQNLLDEFQVEELKTEGLDDPARELRASLESRPDLIPFPGVLGGTMSFSEPYIILLRRPHVFAEFDDGHISGRMLLSYTVTNGKIEWKRLWAELE